MVKSYDLCTTLEVVFPFPSLVRVVFLPQPLLELQQIGEGYPAFFDGLVEFGKSALSGYFVNSNEFIIRVQAGLLGVDEKGIEEFFPSSIIGRSTFFGLHEFGVGRLETNLWRHQGGRTSRGCSSRWSTSLCTSLRFLLCYCHIFSLVVAFFAVKAKTGSPAGKMPVNTHENNGFTRSRPASTRPPQC